MTEGMCFPQPHQEDFSGWGGGGLVVEEGEGGRGGEKGGGNRGRKGGE